MKESAKRKDKIGAPCRFEGFNDLTGEPYTDYPAVFCNLQCAACGWNPEVAARRLERTKSKLREAEGHEAIPEWRLLSLLRYSHHE